MPPWPMMRRLQPALLEEMRAVRCKFKWKAGLFHDQLHPRHLLLLLDECLNAIGFLFYLAECLGSWPEAMRCISFFLLGKPTMGLRTIGLLSALYRIWARLRLGLVRAWAASASRAYFAAGIGKSTEDAVGRLLLTAEAVDLRQKEVVCIVVDVDKCNENVDHVLLRQAAIRRGFPMAIFQLCIDIYRASRRISWEEVVSKSVQAARTLVPGCSIALCSLQLLIISPMDWLLTQLPAQASNLDVYVDDASLQIVGQKSQVIGPAVQAAKLLFQAL